MQAKKSKLYSILFIACFAGFIWLFYNYYNPFHAHPSIETCIFKRVTGIPCPSCGSTRSVILILNGNFLKAIYLNPLGYIVFSIMVIVPIWISVDIITQKSSLYHFYYQTEQIISKRWIAITLTLLILINWIWNIIKQL